MNRPALGVLTAAYLMLSVCMGGCGSTHPGSSLMSPASQPGPLRGATIMAFAVTADGARCRAFYEGVLGLRVIEDDAMALVLDAEGTTIRIQKMKDHQPKPYTVLGWRTPNLRGTVAKMKAAGVQFERFAWMPMQDDSGVATFPNGDMVAWFKDPDGNMLGVSQLVYCQGS